MAVDARGFQLVPDAGKAISQGVQTGINFNNAVFQSKERQNQDQLKALLGQGDIEGARRIDPQAVQKFEQNRNILAKQEFEQASAEDKRDLSNHVNRVAQLKSMIPEQRIPFLQKEITQGEAEGRDLTESRAVLDTLINNPDQAEDIINKGIELGKITGTLKGVGAGLTAGQREFQSLTSGLSREDIEAARRIELGLAPRATGSAAQTILKEGTAEQVANVEATISEKKKEAGEIGVSRAKLRFKPQIEKAVTEARIAAKSRGDTLSELEQAKAALPNLNIAVDELRELSQIATSTIGGQIFDSAVKQSGFGATKGATARAKFIAIVNNQVLPLLKPTFGAAFTVQEGEALKATMGDPDASPEEKMVQLDAFLAQKIRDIETKESQLAPQQEQTQSADQQIKFLGFE